MAPSKAPTTWEDDESDSTPPSSPPVVAQRRKFADEEDDSDVVDSWEAAEDSEVEREKVKRAAQAKAKAEAEKMKNRKSRSQRIEEKREQNQLRKQMEEDGSSEEDEDEAERRARMLKSEMAADLKNAEDLFGGIGVSDKRGTVKAVTVQGVDDPANTIDLGALKIFNPATATQFVKLREVLAPLLNQNAKNPAYAVFLQNFTKDIVRDLNSDQVKKIASSLTTISNEKMREEKAAEKSGKKSKAAKTKTSLAANRNVAHTADLTNYDDGLDEDDFM